MVRAVTLVRQPCFYRAAFASAITGIAAASLKVLTGWDDEVTGKTRGFGLTHLNEYFNDKIYGYVCTLVFLNVVFRNGFSISRYNEASRFLQCFTGVWFDVASSIVAFTKHQTCDSQALRAQHLILRMISMVHAISLGELGLYHCTEHLADDTYGIINAHGIDETTLNTIENSSFKVESAFHMLQTVVANAQRDQIFLTPPPIVTRVFQEMSAGMMQFHEAMRLSRQALPHQYYLISTMLTSLYLFLTAAEFAKWSHDPLTGSLYAIALGFIIWYMTEVCSMLEHPFASGRGLLDMKGNHERLNQQLFTLFEQSQLPIPHLTDEAKLDYQKLRLRPPSVKVSTQSGMRNETCQKTLAEGEGIEYNTTLQTSLSGQYQEPESQPETETGIPWSGVPCCLCIVQPTGFSRTTEVDPLADAMDMPEFVPALPIPTVKTKSLHTSVAGGFAEWEGGMQQDGQVFDKKFSPRLQIQVQHEVGAVVEISS